MEFGVAVIKLLSTWGSNCSSRASQARLLSCNYCLLCFVIWLLLPQTPRICIILVFLSFYSNKNHHKEYLKHEQFWQTILKYLSAFFVLTYKNCSGWYWEFISNNTNLLWTSHYFPTLKSTKELRHEHSKHTKVQIANCTHKNSWNLSTFSIFTKRSTTCKSERGL